jgi:hypothetical protein
MHRNGWHYIKHIKTLPDWRFMMLYGIGWVWAWGNSCSASLPSSSRFSFNCFSRRLQQQGHLEISRNLGTMDAKGGWLVGWLVDPVVDWQITHWNWQCIGIWVIQTLNGNAETSTNMETLQHRPTGSMCSLLGEFHFYAFLCYWSNLANQSVQNRKSMEISSGWHIVHPHSCHFCLKDCFYSRSLWNSLKSLKWSKIEICQALLDIGRGNAHKS